MTTSKKKDALSQTASSSSPSLQIKLECALSETERTNIQPQLVSLQHHLASLNVDIGKIQVIISRLWDFYKAHEKLIWLIINTFFPVFAGKKRAEYALLVNSADKLQSVDVVPKQYLENPKETIVMSVVPIVPETSIEQKILYIIPKNLPVNE